MMMGEIKLEEILRKHKLWLKDDVDGERANLSGADLRSANLRSANLRSADIRSANLRSAYLRHADIRSANLDYSCFPLHCGSKDIKTDIKLVRQLLAHICALDCEDLEHGEIMSLIIPYAEKSHRAKDLGIHNGN